MCCDGYQPGEEEVGECVACGSRVDEDGDSIEWRCHYSPVVCLTCHDQPCDQSC